MKPAYGTTAETVQPLSAMLREAGNTLDKIDADNAAAFAALEATRAPLREARRTYFSIARAMQSKRSTPRLPAGTGDDARAVVQAALDNARKSAALYHDICELGELSSYRECAAAAAQMERDEAIFEELCDRFNARIRKEFDRGATAQARAFEATEYAAERRRGIVRHFPNRRSTPIRNEWK